MNKFRNLISIFLLVFTISSCSTNIKLVENRSKIPETKVIDKELVPDSFKHTFKNEISFWKDVYDKHEWTDVIFYTPVIPKVIEIVKVTFIENSDDNKKMGVSLISKTMDKLLIVDKKTPEELYYNVMNIPEAKEELDLHYDYLNDEFQKKLSKKESQVDKKIGMTRGRKSWYHEKFSSCEKYLEFSKTMFKKNNLPEDIAFLALVESGCTPNSSSSKGALGILQMIEDTGIKNGLVINDNFDERLDPILETQASVKYISKLMAEFKNPLWAINAYHSGEGNLRKAKKWAEKKYPNLDIEKQYEKVVQEFADDKEFNTEEIYFYGKNSARYTILFSAMLEVYTDWKKENNNLNTPNWWIDLQNRSHHDVNYPEKIAKINYEIKSGDTLSKIAKDHFLSLELLQVQLDDENPYLIAGKTLEFSYPKIYSLKEYLDIKENLKIIEDKKSFCSKNPSIKNCLDIDLNNIPMENGSRIFY